MKFFFYDFGTQKDAAAIAAATETMIEATRAYDRHETLMLFVLVDEDALNEVMELVERPYVKISSRSCSSTSRGGLGAAELKARGADMTTIHAEGSSHTSEAVRVLAEPFTLALQTGLKAMLFVGEPAGLPLADAERALFASLAVLLADVPAEAMLRFCTCYLPPDGAGLNADTREKRLHVRRCVDDLLPLAPEQLPVGYGGPVTPEEARALLADERIDALFVRAEDWTPAAYGTLMQTVMTDEAARQQRGR